MNHKISPKAISLTFGVLVLLFATGFYIFAWTEPGAVPPSGNVPAPLNVGSTAQTKTGNLTLPNLYLDNGGGEGNVYTANLIQGLNDVSLVSDAGNNASIFLEDSPRSVRFYTGGTEKMRVDSTGNVGIGDITPASLLTVGNGDLFRVDSSGNLIRIRNIAYSWPSIQGIANTYLKNDGSGNLTWAGVAGGIANSFANIADNSGVIQFSASGEDTLRMSAGTGLSVSYDPATKKVTYTNTGDSSSINEIQNIIANKGLQRDLSNNFGIQNCATGQIMKYNASAQWYCAADDTGAGGGVTQLNAANTTLIISPSTGIVNAQLNLANVNIWTGTQTFNANTYFPGSGIWNTSGKVGIGTVSPSARLAVGGVGGVNDIIAAYANNTGSSLYAEQLGSGYAGYFLGKAYVSGNFGVGGLAGVGTRMVVTDASGNLSSQAIPGGGVTSVTASNGTLTISPTTGSVLASLNLANANTWTAAQTFNANTNFPGSGIWNTSGNVGIGQTSPGAKLAVNNPTTAGKVGSAGDAIYAYANNTNAAISAEQANASGWAGYFQGNVNISGKLTLGTLDPQYEIGGKNWATYGAAIAGGVKEETVGIVKLADCGSGKAEYCKVISFNNLAQGSDLWLFGQVTDFGTEMEYLVVNLTPGGNQNVWYEKNPEQNTLVIYGEASGEVSYRLTSNRHDWQDWPNEVK